MLKNYIALSEKHCLLQSFIAGVGNPERSVAWYASLGFRREIATPENCPGLEFLVMRNNYHSIIMRPGDESNNSALSDEECAQPLALVTDVVHPNENEFLHPRIETLSRKHYFQPNYLLLRDPDGRLLHPLYSGSGHIPALAAGCVIQFDHLSRFATTICSLTINSATVRLTTRHFVKGASGGYCWTADGLISYRERSVALNHNEGRVLMADLARCGCWSMPEFDFDDDCFLDGSPMRLLVYDEIHGERDISVSDYHLFWGDCISPLWQSFLGRLEL